MSPLHRRVVLGGAGAATDGVIEARAPQGGFFPLAERAVSRSHDSPQVLLHHLRTDLLAHVGGHLNDDAAMVALQRTPRSHADNCATSREPLSRAGPPAPTGNVAARRPRRPVRVTRARVEVTLPQFAPGRRPHRPPPPSLNHARPSHQGG
ncbi:SpoIIE family protein phosphatase [Streptomyces sp. NPDC127105]|uniref:SpoIIE family protein phosphatase n=1 Tax=Streptomyces sp. NPDC127105 TaxID=3345359 RepID=UPI0036526B5D